jgi:hypothetical protein
MEKCFLKSMAALLLVSGFNLSQSTDFDVSHLRKEITATRDVQSSTQMSPWNERDLQGSNFTYRANYTAQFQYLRVPLCTGPAPVIQVSCHGPNIQLIGTSDPSIECDPAQDGVDGWSTITCNNTCVDPACEGIYLATSVVDYTKGPYGKIFFQCEGDSVDNIEATLSFLDSGNGACAASTGQLLNNYHVARMGVSCPTESGNRDYVFDDYFFECISSGTILAIPGEGNPGDVYVCVDGNYCDGAPCEIDFDEMIIEASAMNFLAQCVEGVMPVTPTPAPVLSPTQNQLFTFSAKFEASWGLWFDPITVSACSGNTPTVRLTCRNGDIKFVNSTYGTVNCTTVSPGVMECTDNSTNYVDQFTGVVYVS